MTDILPFLKSIISVAGLSGYEAPIANLIEQKWTPLVDELSRVGRISFRRLTDSMVERLDVVVRFLALLEMYKQGTVDLEQAITFGEIDIVWLGLDAANEVVGGIDEYAG